MNPKIKMGNDEFILYIRKASKSCSLINPDLGKKIWEWILLNDKGAIEDVKDEPCLLGDNTPNTGPKKLPGTATQFEFDRKLLPKLYTFPDTLKIQ